jgi:hypothetical protein
MSVDEGVNGMFYLSIATLLCTFMTLSIKYCYKSKCKEVKMCCIKITRDIEVELQEDININNNSNSRDSIRLESPINNNNNK